MKNNKRVKQIQKLLDVAEGNLASARNLLLDILGEKKTGKVDHKESAKDLSILDEGKIIEGIFDGEQMVAPDGKKYPVPANYASKSRLVEGDTLKLTISDNGGFIYKQIKPVERKTLVGTLSYKNDSYSVLAEGKNYKVLFASVTYYKGEPGNKVSIIVPATENSVWAAVESIIHEHGNKEEAPKKKTKISKPETSIDLPEENKEILKEVKESFNKKEVTKVKREETPKTPVDLPKEQNNPLKTAISEDMTIREASQASAAEKTPTLNTVETKTDSPQAIADQETPQAISVNEHPKIKHQESAFISEKDPYEEEDKESNSIEEKPPAAKKEEKIQELEI